MDLNPAMGYRITTLEIERAAVRAERARMAAEHADQLRPVDGRLRRALRALSARRTRATGAEVSVPVTTIRSDVAAPASSAAPVARTAQDARVASPERELVGCAPHAA
ncbi:hypothetical protein [uncultured Microbacterium sp.]|uniref:hypothetical protein n=1 Tax=uncultured Microbacterium sp. TaxID=191216 RepID=UPI0025F039A3|nr:hypothetical protein [uncultured Microbacterium sp.]